MHFFQSIPTVYRVPDHITSGEPIRKTTKVTVMSTEFGKRLKQARQLAQLTQPQLAKLVGITQSTLSEMEQVGLASRHTVKLATVLQVRPEWLSEGAGAMNGAASVTNVSANSHNQIHNPVPVISWNTIGLFITMSSSDQTVAAERWLPCPIEHSSRTFILTVNDESMTASFGRSYPQGCLIFVDASKQQPKNGQRIIAQIQSGDEIVFKIYIEDAGKVWLKPLNPQYPAIFEPFKVLGTVIGKWEDEE
jgi:SOS-response transcriptional repressor LexA